MVPSSTKPVTEPTIRIAAQGGEPHLDRILSGFEEALAAIGWADLTVADVVRRARVSKRTFYEHFASKEACLLALYERESARLLALVAEAIADRPPGEGRVELGTSVYLGGLRSKPWLVRILLVEILHLGRPGLELRRRVMRAFADLLVGEMRATGSDPSPSLAMAVVGGINELILEAAEDDRVDHLGELGAPIAELVRGALRVPASRPG